MLARRRRYVLRFRREAMLIRQLIEEVQDDARLSPYLELIPKKYTKTADGFYASIDSIRLYFLFV